jgi:hypothetical protein
MAVYSSDAKFLLKSYPLAYRRKLEWEACIMAAGQGCYWIRHQREKIVPERGK